METKFWEEMGEGLGARWSAQELGPALAFWLGGGLTWLWHWHYAGSWDAVVEWFVQIDNSAAYLALAVGGLFLLTVSTALARWLQVPLLKLAEGYWPWPFRKLRFRAAEAAGRRLAQKQDRWQELALVPTHERTAAQQSEYARLDAEIARYPLDPRHLLPTRVGNLLRSAEEYSQVRYGLAMSVCWPRLWLVLPEETQTTLSETRAQLNASAQLLLWGALFVAWTFQAWWAALVAVVVVAFAVLAIHRAAAVYGDLIRAAYDLYRFALYEELSWPVPETLDEEASLGRALTVYLFRGFADPDRRFVTRPGK
jgi:uncharacterized membrane protein YphA (DoxX/SURF4 family)